jgi:hypothetical protein
MNKYIISKIVKSVLLLAFFNSTAWAVAGHQHDGDIQPWLAQGKVQLNSTLFETDFGDLSGGAYKTDDPGYDVDTAQGAFSAGNWLRYEGIGTLRFWDGGSWSSTLQNDEQVRIEDALGNTTTFHGTGISNSVGVIGEVDPDGDVHEHIDMSIWDNTGNLGGTMGAYWISLALFDTLPNDDNPVSQASDTLNIIFNRGLPEEQYEQAVSAVPVPAAIYFFISGMLGLGWMQRRK